MIPPENRVSRKVYPALARDDTRLVGVPGAKLVRNKAVRGKDKLLHHLAAAALAKLSRAAVAAGFDEPLVRSGWRRHRWRSLEHYEAHIAEKFPRGDGRKWLAYESPHETGLAVDFGSNGLWPTSSTARQQRKSAFYAWLCEHAAEFGFTPYRPEPWHWEFNCGLDAFRSAPTDRVLTGACEEGEGCCEVVGPDNEPDIVEDDGSDEMGSGVLSVDENDGSDGDTEVDSFGPLADPFVHLAPAPDHYRPVWSSPLNGPDVSRYQGEVDWHAIAAEDGCAFAFCKASEGVGWKDPRFDRNWHGIRDAGMIRGAYHFARVNVSGADPMRSAKADGVAEAEWMLDVVYPTEGPTPGDLPLVLDIEWDKRSNAKAAHIVAFCRAFAKTIRSATGRLPIVYTGPNFWRWKLGRSLDLAACPLWLVEGYRSEPGAPRKTIDGWPWAFHQYTNAAERPDHGRGRMDWNAFRGSESELAELAGFKL